VPVTHKENITDPQVWGPAIRQERIRRNLTLQEMADRLGMNQGNYSRIEKGVYVPKASFVYMLVSEHGFPLEMFMPAESILSAARRLA
jgi:transcriptional regulator with XRE-family HTH domain